MSPRKFIATRFLLPHSVSSPASRSVCSARELQIQRTVSRCLTTVCTLYAYSGRRSWCGRLYGKAWRDPGCWKRRRARWRRAPAV